MIYRSALNAMRSSQEERRTMRRESTVPSRYKSVLSDAELDEDGDMPFVINKPGSLSLQFARNKLHTVYEMYKNV